VRRAAQILLGLAISVLAFGLAFRGADAARVFDALRKANYFWIVPSALLIALGLLFRALSWRVILGRRIPLTRVFDVTNEGYLLNNLLPLRLGEFGRAYLISRHGDLPPLQALASVLVERVIDLLMIVVLLLAFLPTITGLNVARNVVFGSIAVGLGALVALVVAARERDWMLRLARAVLHRIPRLHPGRWEARLAALLDGLAVLRDPRRAFTAAFWSGLAWVAAGLGAWALLRAFFPGAGVPVGFFVLTLVGLGIAVPSAPGAAGVWEFAIVQALSVFQVERSAALSYAIAFHLVHIGVTTLLGGLALAREGETLAHLARSAQALLARTRGAEPEAAALDIPAERQ
jgi:uncharacterized protein (TIRG00374 family)